MNRLLANWRVVVRDVAVAAGIRARSPWRRLDPRPWLVGEREPVVLIPGVYENWQFMLPLARRLTDAGHPVHLLAELRWNTRPIPEQAAIVGRHLASRELRDAVLVGHSKGGLIGKHVLLHDDPGRRVARLVAVASPFAGSSYSRWMPSRALREFQPTAPTVAALAAEARANARITSVYPEWDAHIPEGSRLDGATNVEVPVRGHFRVLVEPVALDAVLAAVDGADPAAGPARAAD
ncbi:alpha/beta hydrolase [Galbitalea sp. SE-J8]|uniref:esterase/lipase family protein n=1 Tax=Galbitalea sp. SE-J8 TaxID=3054952 RepID=UPI00259CDAF3|nr:alpha/beta hydrolase [Galbitalea sp. SE-J8]MDM4761780.1 alpha/beta hydrolase [Galbitalea sp. SE-J8]